MAGGTSRKDHSEVGSSYIHFNYTPDGDKTTASLFGDVPRGVMLNRPPIFLGGQGGAVGPVRVGYGTVVAAGSVLLHDILDDGRLVAAVPPPGFEREHRPHAYRNLTRVVRNNVIYLASLVALEEWYRQVREPFFSRQEMGPLVYAGALEMLGLAKDERAKRLLAMADKVSASGPAGKEFRERASEVCALFGPAAAGPEAGPAGAEFLTAFQSLGAAGGDYIQTIQGLTPDLSATGILWLQTIVDGLCRQAAALMPSMELVDSRP
jgi:bifunctional UDP-N-acetylglucosamine pyrophosphorylase/glucosamine-1-phosphate N-acetyltransferase